MGRLAAMSDQGKRVYDNPVASGYSQFMRSGWGNSELADLAVSPAVTWAANRRAILSAQFPGTRLVIAAGSAKQRSNDTNYRFRPHSAFIYYTGVQGVEATPSAVLILEPRAGGHEALLLVNPRSTRDSDAFFSDTANGELWIGRRFTTAEAAQRWQIPTLSIQDLEERLSGTVPTLTIRGLDERVDKACVASERDSELLSFASAQRLIKDEYEIAELQASVDATALGFADMIRALPAAISHSRGERIMEAAFFGRARLAGNDLGYDTISAAGANACILHWIRNDGDVKPGQLMLIDAGIELDSYYTADITRTFPINGKFTEIQRTLYSLVFEAQKAGFAAIKPGADFKSINLASQQVLAQGLEDLGVLKVSAEESLKPENHFHRRWTLHGVSHMLGLDVHDCAQARKDQYTDAKLAAGMVLTVEPGLYIQPDDELFAPEFRGIGIRIEDDVLVTEDGCRNLSQAMPRHPDEIESWMANLLR
jgi:Xaa-Pro aminopeptidase